MTAPNNFTNRFELLLTNSPASLPKVLDEFAAVNITPTALNAVSQKGNWLAVTVIVKCLEEKAHHIKEKLKTVPAVKSARLEHMVN